MYKFRQRNIQKHSQQFLQEGGDEDNATTSRSTISTLIRNDTDPIASFSGITLSAFSSSVSTEDTVAPAPSTQKRHSQCSSGEFETEEESGGDRSEWEQEDFLSSPSEGQPQKPRNYSDRHFSDFGFAVVGARFGVSETSHSRLHFLKPYPDSRK